MRSRVLTGFLGLLLITSTAGCIGGPVGRSSNEDELPEAPQQREQGCTSNLQCGTGEVCDVATKSCSPGVHCERHIDCGQASYCDVEEGAVCKPSYTASPCDEDRGCAMKQRCVGGRCGCNGEVYKATKVVPNMLIVLDRSESMNGKIGNGQTKWISAKSAITNIVNANSDSIRFGLQVYPGSAATCPKFDNGSCNGGYVMVDVPASGPSAITAAMNSAPLCRGTPTGEALGLVSSYAPLKDTTRDNYVLLLTDGFHSVNCSDPTPPVTKLFSQSPSIKTYVVGFGTGVQAAELNALATAGGTARMGATKYYQANDPAELDAALKEIVGTLASCTYHLASTPPSLNQLYVYFGHDQVARDTTHAKGWDVNATDNQLTFYGASCDQLKTGQVQNLSVVYGCQAVVK